MSTPTAPRRSPRIAANSPVNYYTDDEQMDDMIQAVCKWKKLYYHEGLIDEYNKWRPTAPDTITQPSWRRTEYGIMYEWLTTLSSVAVAKAEADAIKKLEKIIIKYCTKNGIKYEPVMLASFMRWKADPENAELITKPVPLNMRHWDPRTPVARCARTPFDCIRVWFSTLTLTPRVVLW